MSLNPEYKKVNRITIGFNNLQFESLQKLKHYDVNLSQFIRTAGNQLFINLMKELDKVEVYPKKLK